MIVDLTQKQPLIVFLKNSQVFLQVSINGRKRHKSYFLTSLLEFIPEKKLKSRVNTTQIMNWGAKPIFFSQICIINYEQHEVLILVKNHN